VKVTVSPALPFSAVIVRTGRISGAPASTCFWQAGNPMATAASSKFRHECLFTAAAGQNKFASSELFILILRVGDVFVDVFNGVRRVVLRRGDGDIKGLPNAGVKHSKQPVHFDSPLERLYARRWFGWISAGSGLPDVDQECESPCRRFARKAIPVG
jgi:hypothetical protein